MPATARQRNGAIAVCLGLLIATAIAAGFGSTAGPKAAAATLLPIASTTWSLADLLTAFLLLAQFYFSGSKALAILAGAYGLSGLMTWPYIAAFPGLFQTAVVPAGVQQISAFTWATSSAA